MLPQALSVPDETATSTAQIVGVVLVADAEPQPQESRVEVTAGAVRHKRGEGRVIFGHGSTLPR